MAPASAFSESGFDPTCNTRACTMKIPALLVVALLVAASCSAKAASSETSNIKPNEVSQAAAAQLQRLASFKRSGFNVEKPTTEQRPTRSGKPKKPATNDFEFELPIDLTELIRIFNPDGKEATRDKRNDIQLTPAKMDALNRYADKLMQDERVQSYMQERIKRDNAYGGGYNSYDGGKTLGSGNSGAFVSGLAGQLVGSFVGLASSASKGSSSSSGKHNSPAPVYGPPVYHDTYGKESFNIWDFKKAILNTLIQAVKAIGGGVLALKGQLIKGSGYLVSAKGKVISSAGNAISGVGKNLASSAVVHPPHPAPVYGHVGYAYDAPHVAVNDYDGPPPHDGYHSAYHTGAASDDDDIPPGLLVAHPSPDLQSDVNPEHHSAPPEVESVDDFPTHQTPPDTSDPVVSPPLPVNHLQLQDHNSNNYDLYPPLGNGPPDDGKVAQQPPQYDNVDFLGHASPNTRPYVRPAASHHHNYHHQQHHTPDIQIEISDHDITGFETGHGYSPFLPPRGAGLHIVAMKHQGPLKLPIIDSPNPHGIYKRYGYSPYTLNAVSGPGKYQRPRLEIKHSVGYEIRDRIHRI